MRMPRPLSVSAAGVHIVDGWVRWVRIDGSARTSRLRALDAEPVGDDERSALQTIVARQRAAGTATAIHVDAVFARHLVARGALPEDPRAHHDWLQSELHRAGIVGDPADLAVHARTLSVLSDADGVAVRGGETGGTALDLAPQAAVSARQDLLRDAGLVPTAVVSPWAAVAQVLNQGTALVVEPDENTVVQAHDGVVFEILTSRASPTGHEQGDVYDLVVGAGGEDRWFADDGSSDAPELSPELPLAASSGMPLRGKALPPGYGLAAALALVAMDPERSSSFLGAAGAKAGRAAQARGRAVSGLRLAASVLAVSLLTATGWQRWAARDAAAAHSELGAAEHRVRALLDAERELARAARPAASVRVRSGSPSSVVLYKFASTIPADVWLDRLAYRADSSSMELEGEAVDDEAVARLLDKIDASSYFGEARLEESGVRVSPGGNGPETLRQFRATVRVGRRSRNGADAGAP